MEEGEGAEEKGRRFSPSALSPFHFHLSPFPPETPILRLVEVLPSTASLEEVIYMLCTRNRLA